MRAEKTEPKSRINHPNSRGHPIAGTTTGAAEHRRNGRAIHAARRTARRRLCPAVGRHNRCRATISLRHSANASAYVQRRRMGLSPATRSASRSVCPSCATGTLASPPRLLVPARSAKQQALMESAVDALEKVPALHHAAAGKIQAVENNGVRHRAAECLQPVMTCFGAANTAALVAVQPSCPSQTRKESFDVDGSLRPTNVAVGRMTQWPLSSAI